MQGCLRKPGSISGAPSLQVLKRKCLCEQHARACRDDGVGLAAPQVGVNVRLMVYNPSGRRGDEEFILVNPKILNASGRKETAEEGCLSFPRIFADVEVERFT